MYDIPISRPPNGYSIGAVPDGRGVTLMMSYASRYGGLKGPRWAGYGGVHDV